ncbi:MAG: NapC/NirT family cytochrome c [Actinobacteria bacterium]|nr:NapC/NirT family cytochrome c [Actinomycetota bacterium]
MKWPRFLRIYDESGRPVRIKLRYLLLMGAAVAFVGFSAIYLPVAMTSTPSFCSNCHLMEKPVELWEQSTHANVNCIACHVDPGFLKQLEHKVLSYKEIYANFFGHGGMPPDVKRPTNESCLQCHSLDRQVSPGGDIKIPHREHVEMEGLKCSDCHFNVVHPLEGVAGGSPPMDVCYMCHDGKKAPNACGTCHLSPPDKALAHPQNAIENHGKLAKERIADCRRCHSEQSKFCENCHSKPPATHQDPTWRYTHRKKVEAEGREACFGCHQEDFCNKCHKVQHPPDWVRSHPEFAQGGGEPCLVCHSPNFCADCHTKEGVTTK